MKRLLLITDSFPPAFAPRMGYLCKYLKCIGTWNITVLHMPPSDNSHSQSFSHLSGFADEVYEYDGADGARMLFRAVVADVLCLRIRFWDFMQIFVSKCAKQMLGAPTNFSGRKLVRKLLVANEYDVILASTGGHGNTVARLAYFAAQRAKIPLMLDYRDLYEQYAYGQTFIGLRNRFEILQRNRLIRRADSVSGVCQEETDVLENINPRIYTIMNGFDPDIFHPVAPVKSDVFRIVYIGSTNTSTYPVELFAEGMSLFIAGHDKANVKVEFYSTYETYQSGVAHCLNDAIRPYFENRACVEQTKLPVVMSKASVLVVFGHKTVGVPVGVSTKVFEYLAMNRPILEVNLGDRQELENMIADSKSGCVANSSSAIKCFLDEKYAEWEMNGYVCGTTDIEYVKQFSRKNQAEQFKIILENLVGNKD